jgi:hypothetical protein
MKEEVLLALILKKVQQSIKDAPTVARGPRGQRGARGSDGKNFVFTEHEPSIREILDSAVPKFEDLTKEQIELLRGPRGRDGDKGKDFDFAEHEGTMRAWAREFALKFTDLTADDIEKIRGPRGRDGKNGNNGKDFVFTEHEPSIREIIQGTVPKFEDFTAEQIEKIRGPRGREGKDGNNGKDFVFSEHEQTIRDWVKSFSLKFEDLTADEINKLRGPRGKDGKDGNNGKDFDIKEHEDLLRSYASEFALKFSDLAAEEIEKIRGPRGREGKDGKDFEFEEHKETIKELISGLVWDIRGDLKLRFDDLTQEEIQLLRGPRGRRGESGKDFNFEEHREFFESLKPKFADFTTDERDQLVLRFSHLTEEEKDDLKLKFNDLTEEDRLKLRGARGPRGQRGISGRDGTDGKNGLSIRGLPGTPGVRGRVGKDGRDGKDGNDGRDAPYIVDVKIEQYKFGTEAVFIFEFSDGSTVSSERIKLPAPTNVYVGGASTSGTGSSGGSGGVRGIALWAYALVGAFSVDTVYTLPQTPVSADELTVYLNGTMRTDYTLVGDVVTFVGLNTTGQVFDAHLRYGVTLVSTLPRKVTALTGTYGGADTVYVLPEAPAGADELTVWLNGTMRTDYTLVGDNVTFVGQNTSGQVFDAQYRY